MKLTKREIKELKNDKTAIEMKIQRLQQKLRVINKALKKLS